MKTRIAFQGNRGFNLVEVSVALGVFAFAITGIIGLLPLSIQTHRDALYTMAMSRIEQQLISEVLLTESSRITQMDGLERVFDREGREITDSESSASPAAIYRARVEVMPVNMPGASASSPAMRRVNIFTYRDLPNTTENTDQVKPRATLLVSVNETAL